MTNDALTADQITTLTDTVRSLMPQARADLEDLVRIPSFSLASLAGEGVVRSAHAVADLFRSGGMEVEVVTEGGHPAVIGRLAGPEGAPSITLYAHHDIQPTGEESLWETPPFEPTERNGRLYARGAADDKAGVMAHVTAVRAFAGKPPVTINVIVEGEEEAGSDSLPAILAKYGERLRADAIVIADSANWRIGVPSLTSTLRGNVRATVTVSTLSHAVHSGVFGGPLPDAMTAMIRLLATLHDDAGDVAVDGLATMAAADLDYPEADFRADSGLLEGVEMIGTGSIVDRLWTKPTVTVIGMDATPVEVAANVLAASVRARISMRIAPNQTPADAYAALERHLLAHAPWGARVEVEEDDLGAGFACDTSSPIAVMAQDSFRNAWGTEPVDIGMGGSIPFISTFAEQFPDTEILVTGVEDPDARAHGANESLHLGDWENACVAEALLIARLGAASRD